MVGFDRRGAAFEMRQYDDPQGAHAIGADRHRQRQRDEYRPAHKAAVHDDGKKTAEHSRGDQKPQTGASFGDLEIALGYLDHIAVGKNRDMKGMQPGDDDLGGDRLQCWDEKGAARHQKEQKQQRRQQAPEDPRAERHQ